MSRRNCPYGFSCTNFMQQPGLKASQCPNLEACSQLANIEDSREVELQIIHNGQPHQMMMSQSTAANTMLHQRGNPQSFNSLGITSLIATLNVLASTLNEKLGELEINYRDRYIAPEGTEVHTYAVKRPYGKYWYNKLSAYIPMFMPQTELNQVRHIHLSKDDDARCLEAKAGIERRNQMTKIRTQLAAAIITLQTTLELVDKEAAAGITSHN